MSITLRKSDQKLYLQQKISGMVYIPIDDRIEGLKVFGSNLGIFFKFETFDRLEGPIILKNGMRYLYILHFP